MAEEVRIVLPKKLKKILEEKAKASGLTVSDLVLMAIAMTIEEEGNKGA